MFTPNSFCTNGTMVPCMLSELFIEGLRIEMVTPTQRQLFVQHCLSVGTHQRRQDWKVQITCSYEKQTVTIHWTHHLYLRTLLSRFCFHPLNEEIVILLSPVSLQSLPQRPSRPAFSLVQEPAVKSCVDWSHGIQFHYSSPRRSLKTCFPFCPSALKHLK